MFANWSIFRERLREHTIDYSPFGEVSASANVPANPFQWSSEFYDPELALVYYNYRHYSPNLGRWISEDPIGIAGGINLYFYCQNSPIGRWDYLGELSINTFLEYLLVIEKIKNKCKRCVELIENIKKIEEDIYSKHKSLFEKISNYTSDLSGKMQEYVSSGKKSLDAVTFLTEAFGDQNLDIDKLKNTSVKMGKINNLLSKINPISNVSGAISRRDAVEFFLAINDAIPIPNIFSGIYLDAYKSIVGAIEGFITYNGTTFRLLKEAGMTCPSPNGCCPANNLITGIKIR